MRRHILLTGDPGCGKTTVINRVAAQLPCAVGGFFTQEIRVDGRRQGFRMIAFDGADAVLAHVDFSGAHRVGRYGVNLAAIEAVGVASIRRALAAGQPVVIDEIGPMELFSPAFRQAVMDTLNGGGVMLGSIVKRSTPFTDAVKARPDVHVIEVRRDSREALVGTVVALLRAAGWCGLGSGTSHSKEDSIGDSRDSYPKS